MNAVTIAVTATIVTSVTVAVYTTQRWLRLTERYTQLERETDDALERELELLDLLTEMPKPPGYSAVEMEGWMWSWHRWRVRVSHVLQRHHGVLISEPTRSGMPRPLR